LGLKIPPRSAMTMGNCFDKSLNVNYGEKIKTGKDEPVSVIKDCFADTFDKQKGNTVFEPEEKPEQMKDVGVETIGDFHKTVCKTVQPAQVQVDDVVEFDGVDYGLRVIIDLVEQDGTIVDNKYAKRKWNEGRVYTQLDAVVYCLWGDTKLKGGGHKFRYDIGIGYSTPKRNEVKTEVQRFERDVSADEKEGFLKYLAYVDDSIKRDTERGIFLPNVDHNLCSRKSCGYYEICEKTWKHRIKD